MKNSIKRKEYSWLNGHLLGNGDIGAVVWGNSDAVRIGLSKHDINDLRAGGNPKGTRWSRKYGDMRKKIINGDREFLKHIENVEDLRTGPPAQLAAGSLVFETGRGIPVVGYEQHLDIFDASVISSVIPVECGMGWGADFAPINIKTTVLADKNAILIELSSRLIQTILWNFSINPVLELAPPTFSVDDNVSLMNRKLPMETEYSVVVDAPGEKYISPLGINGKISFGGDKGNVRIVIALATNFECDNSKNLAKKIAKSIKREGCSSLYESHNAWWNNFWNQSNISYEDKSIEELWYLGVYLLGASTRPTTSPPNLQGIWNQYNNPPWKADFHFNTNIQECQWLACVSNHPELQEAFVNKFTNDWHENLKSYTKDNFESDGVSVPLCVDWLGRPIGYMQLDLALSMSAWICWHLWQQWEYTKDIEILKNKIYPFLKEAAIFYFDVLNKRDDGRYHIELTQSPEQSCVDENGKSYPSYGSDAVIDIAFIKTLMKSLIDASTILKESDNCFVEKCIEVLKNLPDYPLSEDVLIDYDICFFHTGDSKGQFKVSHRHPSRLTPIYPCGELGLHSSQELQALASNSFKEFRSYGSSGFSGWSIAWQAIIGARLGNADLFEELVKEFKKSYLLPTGVSSHNRLGDNNEIFQIEALLGGAAAINEALIQTSGDIVYLFPAIPESRNASFKSLRVKGGFCVSAKKEKSQIYDVEIFSHFGGKIKLANPWKNEVVTIFSNCVKSTTSGSIIEIETLPKAKYAIA